MVNSIDPDQMPHSAVFLISCHGPLHLIWVFIFCPNLKGGKNILTELPPQKVYTFYYKQNNIFWSEGRGKVKGQSRNRMLLVNLLAGHFVIVLIVTFIIKEKLWVQWTSSTLTIQVFKAGQS